MRFLNVLRLLVVLDSVVPPFNDGVDRPDVLHVAFDLLPPDTVQMNALPQEFILFGRPLRLVISHYL